MKRLLILVFAFLFLFIPSLVSAQGGQNQNRVQDPTTNEASVTPQDYQIQVQNQIQTKNQGEGQMLMVATQQMQQLMNMEGLSEDMGDKVRLLAQEQFQAQNQIQTQLDKFETRSSLMKKLFGSDYSAIKNLKQQVEQNQLRIQELTQLQTEVANQAEESQLQEAVQSLVDQNTALQQKIQSEEEAGGIFGWIVKLIYS